MLADVATHGAWGRVTARYPESLVGLFGDCRLRRAHLLFGLGRFCTESSCGLGLNHCEFMAEAIKLVPILGIAEPLLVQVLDVRHA